MGGRDGARSWKRSNQGHEEHVEIELSQPANTPDQTSIKMHNDFDVYTMVRREQIKVPLSVDIYLIIKNILPFDT